MTNMAWVRAQLWKLQKGALDSQPQVIKFTSCLPMVVASSTTKTGRHEIADILLKVALNTKNQIKSNQSMLMNHWTVSQIPIANR